MTQQTIGIGTAANDGTGDPLRTAFNKANLNFTELYTGLGGLLGKSGAAQALTGTTSETALATIAIPANTLAANGIIRVKMLWTMTSSANNKTPRLRLGGTALTGTSIFSPVMTTEANAIYDVTIANANATNSQIIQGIFPRGTDNLMTQGANTTSAIDMTAAQNLVISGTLALGTETLTLINYSVEYMN